MPGPEIIVSVKNEEALRKLKEQLDLQQKLNTEIENQTKIVDDLWKKTKKNALVWNEEKKAWVDKSKRYTEERNKLEELRKKQLELNKTINETATSANNVSGSFSGLAKKIGLLGAAIGLATKFISSVVDALKDTVGGLNVITMLSEAWKQMAYNVATAKISVNDFTKSIAGAFAVGKMINEQRKEERVDLVEAAKLRKEYNQLYFELSDRTLSDTDRLDKLNEATDKHNKMIDTELKNARNQLTIVQFQLINRPKSNKLLDEEARLLEKLIDIEGRRYSETKRLESTRTALEKEIRDKNMKIYTDWIEERLKKQDEFQKLSLKLLDDYEKSNIESLSGKAKLEAQREFGIKQIKELKDQMGKLGTLSAEQIKMFQTLADNVWKTYYDQLRKDTKLAAPQEISIDVEIKEQEDLLKKVKEQLTLQPESKNILKQVTDIEANISKLKDQKATIKVNLKEVITEGLGIKELPGIVGLKTKEAIDAARKKIENEGKTRAETDFSLWKLIGIDPEDEEGAKIVEAVQDAAGKISDALNETLEQRVEIAQRERELLDTRIAETQREIELEAELAQEGFANNLSARQEYLKKLKIEREQALAAEEKAVKQEQLMAKITQTTNILSGVSNIIATFTKIPIVGLILAASAIASLWAIWGKAKSTANTATEFAEGGSGSDIGVVTGKRHSQGGERFLDHVEVERGEAWGVLSRPASQKYGKVFHDMVSSFNKDEMPRFMPVSNNVLVENSGPNSRLDKVIKEQKRLNESILKQQKVYYPGKKIIQSGNNIRIVG